MLGGLSRFLSGDLGYNGIIIGMMLIILGVIIILAINGLGKRKDRHEKNRVKNI